MNRAEVRIAAIAAAAVVTAGHPENEVAYEEDGKPIGANSVDIAVRIITIAKSLETWVMEASTGSVVTYDIHPPLVEQAEAAGAKQTNAKADEVERTPVAAEGFNPDVCPIHRRAEEGTFGTDMRPLYCPEYKTQKCEWQRKDWWNEDEEGEAVKVVKYRIVKGKGTFMFLSEYMDELRHRNIIT